MKNGIYTRLRSDIHLKKRSEQCGVQNSLDGPSILFYGSKVIKNFHKKNLIYHTCVYVHYLIQGDRFFCRQTDSSSLYTEFHCQRNYLIICYVNNMDIFVYDYHLNDPTTFCIIKSKLIVRMREYTPRSTKTHISCFTCTSS